MLSLVSVQEAASQLQQAGGVTSATIITPGFQLTGSRGSDWLNFAEAIHQKAGGFLLDYQVSGAGQADGFSDSDGLPGGLLHQLPDQIPGHNLVLLYDWAPESSQSSSGWAGAAGDALFSMMVALKLADPGAQQSGPNLDFIAHSFGCAVESEAVKRLDAFHIPVDQVTFLDPHDFDQSALPVDESQREFDLGRPSKSDLGESAQANDGYGATVWDNVAFSDTYYETRGLNGTLSVVVPRGRPIPGTYNFLLSGNLLPEGYPGGDQSGDHSYVWTGFYLGTILGHLPSSVVTPPTQAVNWSQTGFAYTYIAQQLARKAGLTPVARPAPVFYPQPGEPQDHSYSSPALVNQQTGAPSSGLASLGLTVDRVNSGKWTSQRDPMSIADGTFQDGNTTNVNGGTLEPGWSDHLATGNNATGSGDGFIQTDSTGNRYLYLAPNVETRTHNLLYVPSGAHYLAFDLTRLVASSNGGKLDVSLGTQLLAQLDLSSTDSAPVTRYLAIDNLGLQDTAQTLTFTIEPPAGGAVDAQLTIDNVRFAQAPAAWTLGQVIQALDGGASNVAGQSDSVTQLLDVPIPVLGSSFSSALGLSHDLQTPLEKLPGVPGATPNTAAPTATPADNSTWSSVATELTNAGFHIDDPFTGTPAADGNLLQVTWSRTINTPQAVFQASGKTGFDYFDGNSGNLLLGALTGQAQDVKVQMTLGVDVVNGQPTFYLADSSGLSVDGLSATGTLSGTVSIGSLADVDASANAALSMSKAAIQFQSPHGDHKLRASDFSTATLGSLLSANVQGTLSLGANLTAHTNFLPDITFSGTFNGTIDNNGFHSGGVALNPPSAQSLLAGLGAKFFSLGGGIPILGPLNSALHQQIPIINRSIADLTQLDQKLPFLPQLGTLNQDLSQPITMQLGPGTLTINLTTPAIEGLINGTPEDLISWTTGPRTVSLLDWQQTVHVFSIGIPEVASVDIDALFGAHASLTYDVGFGVDTSGFWIKAGSASDPTLGLTFNASAGIQGSVKVLGFPFAKASGSIGFGVTPYVAITAPPPDPTHPRAHLDRVYGSDLALFGSDPATDFLDALSAGIRGDLTLGVHAEVNLLFAHPSWDWGKTFNVFNFQKNPVWPSAGALVNGQDPWANYVSEDSSGVLTFNGTGASDNVGLSTNPDGSVLLDWAGHGPARSFTNVSKFVFHGNGGTDRLTTAAGFTVPIEAYSADNAGDKTYLQGGDGNDTLVAGSGDDTLVGGKGGDALTGGPGKDVLIGGDGNDVLTAGTGDTQLFGGKDNSTLIGGSGNDSLYAGGGNDVIHGGSGLYFIDGGSGNDSIYGDAGHAAVGGVYPVIHAGTGARTIVQGPSNPAQIFGDSGSATIRGGSGNDTIYAGSGGDSLVIGASSPSGGNLIYGGADGDTLIGGAGNNTIYGGAGRETLYGGSGNDVSVNALGTGAAYGSGTPLSTGSSLMAAGSGNTLLFGDSSGHNTLTGGAGNDTLYAGTGGDYLSGGTGVDALYGGPGADSLGLDFGAPGQQPGTAQTDTVVGGANTDTLVLNGTSNDDTITFNQLSGSNTFQASLTNSDGSAQINFTLPADVEQVAIDGGDGNDSIQVASTVTKNMLLFGGAGDDTIHGGSGNDLIVGGPGNNLLFAGSGNDDMYGADLPAQDAQPVLDPSGSLNPTQPTTLGHNSLFGGAGNDAMYAGDGGDLLIGSSVTLSNGQYLLLPGGGRKRMVGGKGNDLLIAGPGSLGAAMSGGGGNDTLVGGSGENVMDGGDGSDLLLGGDLINVMSGDAGNSADTSSSDTLIGGSGIDFEFGAGGNDVLYADSHTDEWLQAQTAAAKDFHVVLPLPAPPSQSDPIGEYHQLLQQENDLTPQIDALTALPTLTADQTAQLQFLRNQRTEINLAEIAVDHNSPAGETVLEDYLDGGTGNDTLHDGVGPTWINGGDGNDTIYGTQSKDTINGGNGTNTVMFQGTNADDTIQLTYDSTNQAVDVVVNGQTSSWRLQPDIQVIGVQTLSGNDNVSVNFGQWAGMGVYVQAGSGNDVIDASTLQAQATLLGGSGNDIIKVGTALAASTNPSIFDGGTGNSELDIIGADGGDTIKVSNNGISATDSEVNGATLRIGSFHRVVVIGGSGTNTFTSDGSIGNVVLRGGSGSGSTNMLSATGTRRTGTITGGSTRITMLGGQTAGLFAGEAVFGPGVPLGATVTSVGTTSIVISAPATSDSAGQPVSLIAGSGTLIGGSGADNSFTLNGPGNYSVVGGGGGASNALTVNADDGGDVIHLSQHGTRISFAGSITGTATGTTSVSVNGGMGNDYLDASGMATPVTLNGGGSGTGADTLVGGSGNDTLYYSGSGSTYDGGGGASNEILLPTSTTPLPPHLRNVEYFGVSNSQPSVSVADGDFSTGWTVTPSYNGGGAANVQVEQTQVANSGGNPGSYLQGSDTSTGYLQGSFARGSFAEEHVFTGVSYTPSSEGGILGLIPSFDFNLLSSSAYATNGAPNPPSVSLFLVQNGTQYESPTLYTPQAVGAGWIHYSYNAELTSSDFSGADFSSGGPIEFGFVLSAFDYAVGGSRGHPGSFPTNAFSWGIDNFSVVVDRGGGPWPVDPTPLNGATINLQSSVSSPVVAATTSFGDLDPSGAGINTYNFALDWGDGAISTTPTVWNLASDFAPDLTSGADPNGQWTYGTSSPTALTGSYNFSASGPITERNDPNAGPSGQTYASGGVQYFPTGYNNNVGLDIPSGAVSLQPGQDGTHDVVRWTAPATGIYNLSAAFRGYDSGGPHGGTTTDVHVWIDGKDSWDSEVTGYNNTALYAPGNVRLNAGDTVDFIVGFGSDGDYVSDNTGLSVSIVSAPGAGLTVFAGEGLNAASSHVFGSNGSHTITAYVVDSGGAATTTTTTFTGGLELEASGDLRNYVGSDFSTLDTGVQSYLVRNADLEVFSLHGDGSLYAISGSLPPAEVGAGIQSMVLAPDGTLYALQTGGILYAATVGATSPTFSQAGVQSILSDSANTAYELTTDGTLSVEVAGESWAVASTKVKSITLATDGSAVTVLKADGSLWSFDGSDWTRIAGPHLVLSAGSGTVAGTSVPVTVTVVDPLGNTVTGYTGTVHFSSSDPNGGLPPDYTFTAADAGSHTFNVALDTAGVQSVTVTDDETPAPLSAAASITVNPAPAAFLSVSAAPSSVAGQVATITVTATDAYGNVLSGYSGTVHLSSDDPTATLPADYTFTANDHGTHTFSVLLTEAGGHSVTVADKANSSVVGSATLVTTAAAPTVAALAGGDQVTLSWSAVNGATAYNIYRATSAGGEGAVPIASGITATSFTDAGLTPGTAYYYEVTAVGTSESPRSPEVSATPFMPGDANGDRSVNFSDLLIVAQHYGTPSGATVNTGDFNGDGKVDFTDLLLLAQNYGHSVLAPGAAAVADPQLGTTVLRSAVKARPRQSNGSSTAVELLKHLLGQKTN